MSCDGGTRTLLEALSSALYKDSEGVTHSNIEVLNTNCDEITPFLSCSSGLITSEKQLQFAIGEDSCGNTTLRIGIPEGTFLPATTVWDDLRAPATGINPIGSPSPATPNTTDGSLTFAKGSVVIAWFQLPHGWKQGTDLHVHIHWSKSTTHNGTVHWQMKYKWVNIGDVMPGFSALTDGVAIIPDSNVADKHSLFEWTAISGVGKTISSMLCVYLSRTSDGGDTFTGNANLYEVDIHYEIDSLGSINELTK